MDELDQAIQNWERDVKREQINLIEQGVAPWEAHTKAIERVKRDRQSQRGLNPNITKSKVTEVAIENE